MAAIELKVPDIGGSAAVIELLVKEGDTVASNQGLLTLESDKATMEVPASAGGVLKQWKVKLGDTLSEGDVIALLEAVGEPVAAPVAPLAASAISTPEPKAAPAPKKVTRLAAANRHKVPQSGASLGPEGLPS